MSISLNGDGIISGVSTLTNPSEITVGTGASVFSPASNTLALGTNGSERVRIDSLGNFGTNIQSIPSYNANLRTVSFNGTNGVVHDYAVSGTRTGSIVTQATGVEVGTHTSSPLIFTTNSSERARILATGGLTFNGDTAAANALDDYEEGTWTPVLTYETPGTLSLGYNVQQGHYTKVGNLVHFRAEIRLNAFTKGTASGNLGVSGLPFTAKAVTGSHYLTNVYTYNSSLPATLGQYPAAQVNSTLITLITLVSNSDTIAFPDPDSNAQYKISGTYMT